MKCSSSRSSAVLLCAVSWLGCLSPTRTATLATHSKTSPVDKVVPLIIQLQHRIEDDGRKEQKSYDRYQCWCEDTLARKANDISTGKARITKLTESIIALNGEIASHAAEIKNLKKDIAANLAAQREASDVREQERAAYNGEKTESEQCIGALESAITVLAGAGTKGGGFLETVPEAQLLSAAADVGSVLEHGAAWRSMAPRDLDAIRRFVAHPAARETAVSAAQVSQNPFGDYAPQSTRIQGILKGMYDSFTSSLEKANVEEARKQKSFEEFMQTKKLELQTLQTTLEKQEMQKATKDKTLSDNRIEKDDTKLQLDADEAFFEETKASCRRVAEAWSERSRLRSQELRGIEQAVSILTSDESKATFSSAAARFLQVSSVKAVHRGAGGAKSVYVKLRTLASKFGSLGLAQIAAEMKTGGHFDKVIIMIDHLVERIRKEEADDIAHRDRCQNSEKKNSNDMEDLKNSQTKTTAEIQRLGNREEETRMLLQQLDSQMTQTKDKMRERLSLRNEERIEFERALEDDANAISVIQQAILALTEFYKRNRIPLALSQQHKGSQEPEYTIDADKAPELEWKEEYGGRKSESTSIIGILSVISEDFEKEMKTAREDDAVAQEDYEADNKAMTEMLHAQMETSVASKKKLAEIQEKIASHEELHEQTGQELTEEQMLEATLQVDCSWVATHFDERRTKRKAELEGLAEAKSILAGADKGDYDEAVLMDE